MKTLFIVILIFVSTLNISMSNTPNRKVNIVRDFILEAIIETESNGRNIAGKTGDAGILQITKSFLDDVNRIVGYRKYNMKDRYNIEKSIEMYYIIQNYYNPTYSFSIACQVHHRATKVNEQQRYYNKTKSNLMKVILKDCDPKHRGMILQYISSVTRPKHNVIEVKTKEIKTNISYLNSETALSISLSPTLLNIPNNIGSLIKDLI